MNALLEKSRPGVRWSQLRLWAASLRTHKHPDVKSLAVSLCCLLDEYHRQKRMALAPQLWHSCMLLAGQLMKYVPAPENLP